MLYEKSRPIKKLQLLIRYDRGTSINKETNGTDQKETEPYINNTMSKMTMQSRWEVGFLFNDTRTIEYPYGIKRF